MVQWTTRMLKLIRKKQELIVERNGQRDEKVGFVPTMGNLHLGHISLLEKALEDYKTVYFSIFVNPLQFGPHEDFNHYPRTLDQDLELISKSLDSFPDSRVVVYSPSNPEEVFPPGHNQIISVYGLNNIVEGKVRPGHFDGVATVVFELFDLTKPATAYFGLKDFQQYITIKQMVKDLNLPINIYGMPIIREKSGLALSSRNQYLTREQKEISLILFQTLKEIKLMIDSQRVNIPKAKHFITEVLKEKKWNYLELRDSQTFSEDLTYSNNISILAVYQIGTTRLLDNLQVEVQ
jgi:pantoate--beta-alanine ligase